MMFHTAHPSPVSTMIQYNDMLPLKSEDTAGMTLQTDLLLACMAEGTELNYCAATQLMRPAVLFKHVVH